MRIEILHRLKYAEWALLSAIVATGFVLRIVAQSHLAVIGPDGMAYIYHATKILNGTFDFERRGPFFQLLLIAIFRIFGVNYTSSILIPQFFGSIIPIVMFILGKYFFDSKTGLVAALLASVNSMLILSSCWVLRETLILTLILTFILGTHYTMKVRSKKRRLMFTIFSGIITGLLILTREDLLFVIPPAWIVYTCIHRKGKRDLSIRVSLYLTMVILIITPWLVYSSQHFGHPLHSYMYYILREIGKDGGTSDMATGLFVAYRVIYGLWNEMAVLPAIFSVMGFAFLPIGMMFTLKRRDIWIVYFLIGAELILLAYLFGRQIQLVELVPYQFFDVDRIPFSVLMPANLIIAYGIRRFITFFLRLEK